VEERERKLKNETFKIDPGMKEFLGELNLSPETIRLIGQLFELDEESKRFESQIEFEWWKEFRRKGIDYYRSWDER